jgi:hypothetical protein
LHEAASGILAGNWYSRRTPGRRHAVGVAGDKFPMLMARNPWCAADPAWRRHGWSHLRSENASTVIRIGTRFTQESETPIHTRRHRPSPVVRRPIIRLCGAAVCGCVKQCHQERQYAAAG